MKKYKTLTKLLFGNLDLQDQIEIINTYFGIETDFRNILVGHEVVSINGKYRLRRTKKTWVLEKNI